MTVFVDDCNDYIVEYTSVCVFNGNPTISSRVVSFNDVRWTSPAPAAHDEHYLVRYSRSCYWVGQIDVLAFLHVKVVQELDRLDDDRLALLVVVNQRVFLNRSRAANDAVLKVRATAFRTVGPFAVGRSNGRNASHVTMPTVCDRAALRRHCRFRTSALHRVGVYVSHMF